METLFIYKGNSYVLNKFMKNDTGLFNYIDSLSKSYDIQVKWSPLADDYIGRVYNFDNLSDIADIFFDIRRVG